MEIGIFSFGDVAPELSTDPSAGAGRRLRELLEEVALADELGLDVVGLGEHHRPDYAISTPAVVLAAVAARTTRIRLSSAVTVLSSDDPVRVFQDFATLDLLSGGRAEIMVGRGSFIESFPLFGYDLADYADLFTEKLELLLRLREGERVSWRGGRRPAIEDRGVYPRPLQDPLPVWIAAGGTPSSAARAGRLGLPLALAIIGGEPARFAPFARIHREAAEEAGHAHPAFGISAHGFLADTSQAALDAAWPGVSSVMNRIGRERGWVPMDRADYELAAGPRGAEFTGSPQQVIEKMLSLHDVFGHDRFLLMTSVGPTPHAQVMRSIELLGTEVAPAVRAAAAPAPASR